jgi:hypothetical protein
VNLGPVQPIEAIRLLLALFLAGYFARKWEYLRQLRTETIRDRAVPGWINVPGLDHVLPVVAWCRAGARLVLLPERSRTGAAADADLPVDVSRLRAVAHGSRAPVLAASSQASAWAISSTFPAR